MVDILCYLLDLYFLAIFGRIIMSWFPVTPGGVASQIFSVLYAITEPVLGPLRRALPPIGGMFDLSRRLVDFASGLCYGMRGSMERVTNQVYLLTPSNVEVSAEEKRRLREND